MRTILVSIIIILMQISPLKSLIIHVPKDSITIQGGINGAIDGDTVMVSPGTYYEYNINFHGKAITVMSTNPEDSIVATSTIVDADSKGSVFYFNSSEDSLSILAGFTIKNGFANKGAGIFCSMSSPLIRNNIITSNIAEEEGGGIYCLNSHSIIYNNVLSRNSTLLFGAGVSCSEANPKISLNLILNNDGPGIGCNSSSPLIDGNVIRGNIGGIACTFSTPTINNNIITENTSSLGAGIFCTVSELTIANNMISDNSASISGGGIYCDRSFATIENNTISNNFADNGAGIHCMSSSPLILGNKILNNQGYNGGGMTCEDNSSPTIFANTFSENSAVQDGGGLNCFLSSSPTISKNVMFNNSANEEGGAIFCRMSSPLIINNSIAGNISSEGAGIYLRDNSSPILINSILWNNTANIGSQVMLEYGSRISISYSDLEGGQDSINVCADCIIDWGLGNINENPLFRDVGSDDFHLMADSCGDPVSSNCIDVGHPEITDSILDCSNGLGDVRSDMGAYGGDGESPSIIIDRNGPKIIQVPKTFFLSQNYPNPFNPSTTIRYSIPEGEIALVNLFIYDLRGRLICTLINEERSAGNYSVNWDGRNSEGKEMGSGVFIYRLESGKYSSTRKMTILR